jgi:hypothetical protein
MIVPSPKYEFEVFPPRPTLTGAVTCDLNVGERSELVPNARLQVSRSHTFDVIAAHDTNDGFQNVVSIRLESVRAADLKRWIGTQDAEIDRGVFNGSTKYAPPDETTLAELATRDLPRAIPHLVTAMCKYLYGRARDAQSYEATIERYLGPFIADAYVLDRLTVRPSGKLVLGGRASLLQVRYLEIQDGGTIDLRGTARVDVGTFEKRAG